MEDRKPSTRRTNQKLLNIKTIFEKKFTFSQSTDKSWQLPPVTELFCEFYQFAPLQEYKKQLNEAKSLLNEFELEEWSAHTYHQDPAGNIRQQLKSRTKAELVTVAWCKFYEILNTYALIASGANQLNSLHLCEAPGAFVAALNHHIKSRPNTANLLWKWRATTLNPYYEGNPRLNMIIDDRMLLHTLDNWLFHADFTGNIMSGSNISHMQAACKQCFHEDGVNLITADGSIDCMDVPDIQEEHVSELHLAEIISALSILKAGGNFVIKLFTFYEAATVCKLYLLACAFKELHIFKPASSRRGNSEVYAICLNYEPQTPNLKEILKKLHEQVGKAQPLPMFRRAHLPADFVQEVQNCAAFFMEWQIAMISDNLNTFKSHNNAQVQQVRWAVCAEYFYRFNVRPIGNDERLLPHIEHMPGAKEAHNRRILQRGSHTQRKQAASLPIEERVFNYRRILHELHKSWPSPAEQQVSLGPATVKLQLIYGRRVDTLRSSMFLATDVILFSGKLQQLFDNELAFWQLPEVGCAINEMRIVMNDVRHLCDFGASLHNYFKRLVKGLVELDKMPQELHFHNLPILTHFSASIVYYLAHNIYNNLSINMNDKVCQLTLSGLRHENQEAAAVHVAELHQVLNEEEEEGENNKNILCLVDLTLLHNNEFYGTLMQLNNAILLQNCELFLNRIYK